MTFNISHSSREYWFEPEKNEYNYNAEQVWGFCQAKQVERVHLKFCKDLLKFKSSTHNDFGYVKMERMDFR